MNVLVALIDPKHVSHETANDWLAVNLASGWATCPLTEMGCLRVITNARYSAPQLPGEVLVRLRKMGGTGHHKFWPADLSVSSSTLFDWSRLQGHQQLTDTYLLGLAMSHRGRFVTFDRGVRLGLVAGSGSEHLVIL